MIKSMLTENTGVYMCDSGGKDGRMWQRNQNRDFENEPRETFEDYGITISTYHFLMENVKRDDFSVALEKQFYKQYSDADMSDMEDFACEMHSKKNGWAIDVPQVTNTYNGDSLVEQTLQYVPFFVKGVGWYVALQIHNGADVRAGYTKARIFKMTSEQPFFDVLSWNFSVDNTFYSVCGGEYCDSDGNVVEYESITKVWKNTIN